MSRPFLTTAPPNPELEELLRRAVEHVKSLTPEQQAEMARQQRESAVRVFLQYGSDDSTVVVGVPVPVEKPSQGSKLQSAVDRLAATKRITGRCAVVDPEDVDVVLKELARLRALARSSLRVTGDGHVVYGDAAALHAVQAKIGGG